MTSITWEEILHHTIKGLLLNK